MLLVAATQDWADIFCAGTVISSALQAGLLAGRRGSRTVYAIISSSSNLCGDDLTTGMCGDQFFDWL